jgi:hypothetical protein
VNDVVVYCRRRLGCFEDNLACDDKTLALIIHKTLYSIMARSNFNANIYIIQQREAKAAAMTCALQWGRAEPEDKQKAALLEMEVSETILSIPEIAYQGCGEAL